MNKFVIYDKNDSALQLARALTEAKKARLKYIYEIKFIYGQELLKLSQLIDKKTKELEYMAAKAQTEREEENINSYTMYIN